MIIYSEARGAAAIFRDNNNAAAVPPITFAASRRVTKTL
jgi:hypothetical protein